MCKQPGDFLEKNQVQRHGDSADAHIDKGGPEKDFQGSGRFSSAKILADDGRTSVLKANMGSGTDAADIIGDSQSPYRQGAVDSTHGIYQNLSQGKSGFFHYNREGQSQNGENH